MKIKMLVAFVCIQTSGCASLMFSGWEQVKIEQSVHLKPCMLLKDDDGANAGKSDDFFRKMAIYYDANTVVRKQYGPSSYFKCSADLPPYHDPNRTIWVAYNKFDKTVTQLDLNKSLAKCTYETNKATVDTSRANPARIFVPTGNLQYDTSQINAIQHDRLSDEIRSIDLSVTKTSLFRQCLLADGFVDNHIVETEKSLSDLNKTCPGINNKEIPCLISQ